MNSKVSILNFLCRYAAVFAYSLAVLLGNGIHVHSDSTDHGERVIHAHDTSGPNAAVHEFFHHYEDHQHVVSSLHLISTQPRLTNTQSSSVHQHCTEFASAATPVAFFSRPYSRQHFDSPQYTSLDGTSSYPSGVDPPFSFAS